MIAKHGYIRERRYFLRHENQGCWMILLGLSVETIFPPSSDYLGCDYRAVCT